MNVCSEVPLDQNLALISHDNPGGHPSCHGHSRSTSSDDRDYKEPLDDLAGCYNPTYFDDSNASFGVGVDLNEEPISLLIFLRDRLRAVMKGRFQLDLPIETEIVLYHQVSRS